MFTVSRPSGARRQRLTSARMRCHNENGSVLARSRSGGDSHDSTRSVRIDLGARRTVS